MELCGVKRVWHQMCNDIILDKSVGMDKRSWITLGVLVRREREPWPISTVYASHVSLKVCQYQSQERLHGVIGV